MPVCAVSSCRNKTSGNFPNKGVTFHKFPSDETTRQQWIHQCKRADNFIVENSKICSIHFKKEDYLRDLENELLGQPPRKKRRLLDSAVPSLHLDIRNCSPSNLSKNRTGREQRQTARTIRQNAMKSLHSTEVEVPLINGFKMERDQAEMILGIGDHDVVKQGLTTRHTKAVGRKIYLTDDDRKAADAKRRREKREVERRQVALKKARQSQTTLTLALANISQQVTRTITCKSQKSSFPCEDVKPFFDATSSMSIIIEPGREAEDVNSKCVPRVQIGHNLVTILETQPLRNKNCGCVMCPVPVDVLQSSDEVQSSSNHCEESRREFEAQEQDGLDWSLDNVKIEIREDDDIEVMPSDPLTLEDFNQAGMKYRTM